MPEEVVMTPKDEIRYHFMSFLKKHQVKMKIDFGEAEIGETPLTILLRRSGLLPPLTQREIRWRWIRSWFDGYHWRMMRHNIRSGKKIEKPSHE